MADLHDQGASDARSITISTTVQHAGRVWTVAFTGYTLQEAAAILEAKGLAAASSGASSASEAAPVCPDHGTPMRPGKRGGWFCSRKDGDTFCSRRA
jgi:hypothetical protein